MYNYQQRGLWIINSLCVILCLISLLVNTMVDMNGIRNTPESSLGIPFHSFDTEGQSRLEVVLVEGKLRMEKNDKSNPGVWPLRCVT